VVVLTHGTHVFTSDARVASKVDEDGVWSLRIAKVSEDIFFDSTNYLRKTL